MRIIALIAILSLCVVGIVKAEEGITVKQHMIYTWNDGEAKNVTSATIVKTKAIEGAPKWVNMIIDGWCIDAGAAYEDETVKDAAILAGRELGTLGEYVPWLIFPFKDRIQITLDIAGAYLPDITHHIKPQGCTGFGYIKGTLKF